MDLKTVITGLQDLVPATTRETWVTQELELCCAAMKCIYQNASISKCMF